jgi:predicted ATPase/ATP/maltotriose-dependent transcriptional regulator MalT
MDAGEAAVEDLADMQRTMRRPVAAPVTLLAVRKPGPLAINGKPHEPADPVPDMFASSASSHGGSSVEPAGFDEYLLAEFAQPVDAVAAAVELQAALADGGWPSIVCAAIHSAPAGGLVASAAGLGPVTAHCTRLLEIGHGGQTLLSDEARNLVIDALPSGVTVLNLGVHRLKDAGPAVRVWQVCDVLHATQFPPLWSLDALPTNLPVQLTSLVGRDVQITEVTGLLRAHRLVTLTGAGGVGKSRLALQAAAAVTGLPADGVWWAELGPVADPERIPHAVASIFGWREDVERPVADMLVEQLRTSDLLLVLDNCEHVLDAVAALVGQLLQGAPGVQIMVTSREPLAVRGEVAWRVPSLDEPAAIALFVDRAACVQPRWETDAAQAGAVSQICRRLDGIPLAIELAAARTRMMDPAQIAAGLDDRFRLLTGSARGIPRRQQTLESSVAWSYDLLDEQEQKVFRRLAVFSGGFSLQGAETVCPDSAGIDAHVVLDLLTRLVDKSLVQVTDHARTWYRLLETVRDYARARLADAGEVAAAHAAHLRYYLDYVERTEPGLAGGDGPGLLSGLELDRDNLRAALECADTRGDRDAMLRLVAALAAFWVLRGHTAEGGRWCARALATDEGSSVLRARALWAAAYVAVYADDHQTFAVRAPEALALSRELGDAWATARATNVISYVNLWQDAPGALADLAGSIALARSVGDDWAEADGLKMMTIAWEVAGDLDAADTTLAELLQVARRLDNKFYLAWYHTGVAFAALQHGEFDQVRAECDRALQLCAEVGDPSTAGVATAWLGEAEALTGHTDAARSRYESFLQRARVSGGDQGFPFVLINLITLLTGCGQADAAAALSREALARIRGEPDGENLRLIVAWLLAVHGAALATAAEEALPVLDEARRIATATANPFIIALVSYHLGRLAREQGDISRAEDLHQRALALRRANRLRPGVAESLEAIAGLIACQDGSAEAVRLFAAADRLRVSLGLVRWPAQQDEYDQDLTDARRQIGAAAFASAWAEGHALSEDDAAAYAARGRGQRRRPATGWASLTPTEVAVVELLTEGLTNPQIADRMFVSTATVKTHLIHIFSKLGVTTRAQLAAAATRRVVS